MKKLLFFSLFLVCLTYFCFNHVYASPQTAVFADDFTDTSDSLRIQKAINFASQSGNPKTVILSDKDYNITSPIVIKKGVKLQFSYGSRFVVYGNFKVLEFEQNSSLDGAYIAIADNSFDSDILYFDGKYKYYNSWNKTSIRDVTIVNWVNSHKGTGISLYAGGPQHEISFIDFDSIKISGMKTGIYAKVDIPSSGYAWINANRFTNFTLEDCIKMIEFSSSSMIPNEISGNLFTNLQIQSSTYTTNIATITGSYNYLQGMVWDTYLMSASHFIKLTNQSVSTIIDIPTIPNTRILDEGTLNVLNK